MVSDEAKQLKEQLKTTHFREQLMTAFEKAQGKRTEFHLTADKMPSNLTYKAHEVSGHLIAQVSDEKIKNEFNQNKGDILMFHGGGFVVPAGKAFVQVALDFVSVGYTVWLADYPLLNQATSHTLRSWVLEAYRLVKSQTSRLIIFGDSAGANIALRLRIDIRDEGLDAPIFTEIFSSSPDFTMSNPEVKAMSENDLVLDRDRLVDMFSNSFDKEMTDNFAFNDQMNYQNLGEIRVDTGTQELFAPDNVNLAMWLDVPGTKMKFVLHQDMVHDFIMWPQLPESKETMTSLIDDFDMA